MFRVNPKGWFLSIPAVLVLAACGLLGCRKETDFFSICQVQGPTGRSPLLGREVVVQGVVTGVFRDQESEGFFVQDQECPGDRPGSRGLLILHERWIVLARPGDTVAIQGLVVERDRMTALNVKPDQVRVIEEGVDLPAARTVPGRGIDLQEGFSWEDLEGVLVQLHTIEVSGLQLENQSFWRGQARVIGGNGLDVLLPASLSDLNQAADRIPGTLVLTRVTGVIWEREGGYSLYGLLPPDLPVVYQEALESESASRIMRVEHIRDPASKPHYPFVPALYYQPLGTVLTPGYQSEVTAEPAFVPADLLITEFLPDPPGSEPDGEWIEIFNPESISVPLYHYKIGDAASSSGREGMVRFPEGSLIEPKEVVVIAGDARTFYRRYGFYPDYAFGKAAGSARTMEPYPDWGGTRVQLSNAGDEILILDGGDRIVDQAAYGGSALQDFTAPPRAPGQGNSLERYPPKRDTNSGRDWRERVEPSPGRLDRSPPTSTPKTPQPSPTGADPGPTATAVPGYPSLSEVMADPPGPEPDGEWIEIYNPYSYAYPLGGFTVRDALPDSSSEGWFLFPDGAFIPPRDVVIIAKDPDTFLDTYGISPDFGLDPPSGWDPGDRRGSFRLRNAGDEIYLVDQEGVLVDGMSYGDSAETRFHLPAERVPEGWSYARSLAGSPEDPDPGWLGVSEPSPGEISIRDTTQTPIPTSASTQTPIQTPTLILTATPAVTQTAVEPSATPSPPATRIARTFTITPTLIPSPDRCGLKISEVMINPRGPDPGGEWVELINLGPVTVKLDDFQLGDHTGQGREGMRAFPPGSRLDPKGILVVANRGEDFLALHGFLPDYEIMDTLAAVPDLLVPTEGPTGAVAFRNSGDEIRLLENTGGEVDSLAYGDSAYVGFQPPVPRPGEGSSLERYPAGRDRDQAGDWREQGQPSPGKYPAPEPTRIPSLTSTLAPTASLVPGLTQTITPVPTCTPTASSTPSAQPTLEPVPTLPTTPSPTCRPTASSTMELTPTRKPVPTATVQPSLTPSPTGLPTATSSLTAVPTREPKPSATSTPPSTCVPTASSTIEPTPTRKTVPTATVQPSLTPLPTGNVPGSPTPAISATSSPLAPGSSTPVPSLTPSAVWTSTATPIAPTAVFPSPVPSAVISPTASLVPSPKVVCNEIHADPHPVMGDANQDGERSSGDDEFVELVNLSGRPLDLTGWTISDGVRIRFRFPEGSSLENMCAAVVFGGGSPSGSFGGSLVYAAGSLGLNNSGDQITLTDAGGVIQASCSYGPEGGEDQSLTRAPDLSPGAMIPHSSAPGSAGRIFSPGTRLDGGPFEGCQ